MIAEYSDQQQTSGGTSYLTADHLGTPRVITRADGTVSGRHDYQPFGEEIPATFGGRASVAGYAASDTLRQQFTHKERDSETGLDYFLARYFSSAQGRFISADEFSGGPDEIYYFVDDASANPTFYADLGNPQSLNKYQYSFNNPLRYVDPDGHEANEPEPVPDPPQGQDAKRIPIIRGPGPTPAEAQQTVEALKKVWEWPDPYLYPISQTIGTAPDPTIEPVPIPPMVPPAPQVQPMPAPPPMEARAHRKGKRKSTKKKHQEGSARKKRDYGGEKGDAVRRPPRRPPGGKTPKGGWPPKPPKPPEPPKPKPPEPKPTPLP
jgi:RHS repeat-associated protein